MSRIITSKPFLYVLLISLVVISVIERIKIGGWILALGWWILILFPMLHFTLHYVYLQKIHFVKRRHLGIILYSHLAYFLFFVFQYDFGDGPAHVILFDVVKTYSPLTSIWLYNSLSSQLYHIFLITFINYLLAEIIFIIRIRQYIRTEAIVVK